MPITRWHNQDCLLGYVPPVPMDGMTPPHIDDVYMLWFICQGKIDLIINDACFPVPPGSLLWTSPSLLHAHRAAGNIEVLWCFFSPSFVQEVWQDIWPRINSPHAAIIPAAKPLYITLLRLIHEIKYTDRTSSHLFSLLSHITLVDILRMFFSQQKTYNPISTSEVSLGTSSISESIAQAIILFRSECCREEITPKQAAEQVGLSLFHFTRRFKQEVGIAPGHYLRELRLNQASHLLLSTRLPLDEIAQRMWLELCSSSL